MDVKTRNRADLKAFFVKNSIPTQSNFADLIDGMLNQKDDGLAKSQNVPLSIEAAGAGVADSEKKAMAFYQSFADPNPAWTLSLNPRADPQDPKTAKLGLAISDGEGMNRLFIDRNSGHVGIGTMTPGAKLEVNATTSTHGGWLEAIRFTRVEHSAITLPAAGLLFGLHSDRNFYFADIKDGFKKYVMGINAESGNVGIGINPNPEKRLHIEAGELKVRASHNNTTADIGAFFAQNLTQGIGIGYDRIQAIGSAGAQSIQIIAKGAGHVFLKTGGDRYVVMQADGNLVIYDGGGRALWASGTNISDVREKENIHAIDNALAKVLRLRGVSFSWKDKTMGGNEEIGLVAQEVETVIPYLVHSVDRKTKMIRYEKCVPLLVEAIKEQHARIEQLRGEIQLLKT